MTLPINQSTQPSAGIPPEPPPHPLTTLPREDLDLIAELVLQRGSLKDLASAYGVSYPTARTRVDKVIDRLRGAMAGRAPDPLSDLLASLVERGELTMAAAHAVRQLVRTLHAQPGSHSGDTP